MKNEWVATQERLPECDQHVLIVLLDKVTIGFLRQGWGWQGLDGHSILTPTHWMPCPALPQAIIDKLDEQSRLNRDKEAARASGLGKLTQEERDAMRLQTA